MKPYDFLPIPRVQNTYNFSNHGEFVDANTCVYNKNEIFAIMDNSYIIGTEIGYIT